MRYYLATAIALLLVPSAVATPVSLQVDPAQSSITVQLCMTIGSTRCDSDTSPVVGFATVSLDCLTNPADLTLYDCDFLLTQDINLTLDWGFFVGRLDATATNVELFYATPGVPMPPTPLGPLGDFLYTGIPVNAAGLLAYNATSLVCAALAGSGLLCNDTIDLSTLVLNPLDMAGTVAVSGRDITMTININTTAPLDPANPGLGDITMTGTIVAAGTVPLPDVPTFIGVLLGNVTNRDLICESDMDGNGGVDALDIRPYLNALLGP